MRKIAIVIPLMTLSVTGKISFLRLADYPGPWQGMEPVGNFYDVRPNESQIYSKGG